MIVDCVSNDFRLSGRCVNTKQKNIEGPPFHIFRLCKKIVNLLTRNKTIRFPNKTIRGLSNFQRGKLTNRGVFIGKVWQEKPWPALFSE